MLTVALQILESAAKEKDAQEQAEADATEAAAREAAAREKAAADATAKAAADATAKAAADAKVRRPAFGPRYLFVDLRRVLTYNYRKMLRRMFKLMTLHAILWSR